ALAEQQAVDAGGPQYRPHRIVREAGDEPAGRQQLLAVAGQQAVDLGEPGGHLLRVLAGFDLLALEGRTVAPPFQGNPLADGVHLVRPDPLPLQDGLGRGLAGDDGDTAQVDAFELLVAADAERKKPDAQRRLRESLSRQPLIRPGLRWNVDPWMEQGFEVDHHRLIAGRDEVLELAVR